MSMSANLKQTDDDDEEDIEDEEYIYDDDYPCKWAILSHFTEFH